MTHHFEQIKGVFLIYFLNHALASRFTSKMVWLGFFIPPMPRPGIELTSANLHLFEAP